MVNLYSFFCAIYKHNVHTFSSYYQHTVRFLMKQARKHISLFYLFQDQLNFLLPVHRSVGLNL
jgi:tRNA(His) 5'-end guanylyltransferase